MIRRAALGAIVCAAIVHSSVASAGCNTSDSAACPRAMKRQEISGRAARIRLNTLKDIHLALELCWRANLPPIDVATPGVAVVVRLSFTRAGEILGEPAFTFTTPGISSDVRARYQRAAAEALNSCTPLPFSEALGRAVAGQPRVFTFIDRRTEKKA